MMLAFGRCRLVVGTIDVSCGNDDCVDAADVGEDVLALLIDVSSPPSPVSPSGCDDDDDVLSCSTSIVLMNGT